MKVNLHRNYFERFLTITLLSHLYFKLDYVGHILNFIKEAQNEERKKNIPEVTKLKEISNLVEGYSFDKIKHKIEDEHEAENSNPYKGKIDPYLIKGSMSVKVAAQIVNVDIEEFYKMFEIPDGISSMTRMKDIVLIEPTYDFEEVKASLE